jgi:16S rRNA (adenine1518-N6/adenine1519-N6)-dimethyltransferase
MVHQTRKRFGQHFLTDEGIIRSIIARIAPQSKDYVIEIGPGTGAMTYPLLDNLNQLEVVEIDRDLIAFWQAKKIGKLTIHAIDALQFDFYTWAKNAKANSQAQGNQGGVKVVGNLPYNISSPLLFHLISAVEFVDEQVFMLQKEVVERMVAAPGDSEYSRLSVMLQTVYHLENCFEVPPESFEPAPRVDSAIVAMWPKKNVKIEPETFQILEKLVALAFSQRRKMLANNLGNLKHLLALDAETLKSRAQNIPVETYLDWAHQLAKIPKEDRLF